MSAVPTSVSGTRIARAIVFCTACIPRWPDPLIDPCLLTSLVSAIDVEQAWRARCPELLDTGRAAFQGHDFFMPQPPWPASLRSSIAEGHAAEYESEEARKEAPAVFLLRVITHDWPDEYVTRYASP